MSSDALADWSFEILNLWQLANWARIILNATNNPIHAPLKTLVNKLFRELTEKKIEINHHSSEVRLHIKDPGSKNPKNGINYRQQLDLLSERVKHVEKSIRPIFEESAMEDSPREETTFLSETKSSPTRPNRSLSNSIKRSKNSRRRKSKRLQKCGLSKQQGNFGKSSPPPIMQLRTTRNGGIGSVSDEAMVFTYCYNSVSRKGSKKLIHKLPDAYIPPSFRNSLTCMKKPVGNHKKMMGSNSSSNTLRNSNIKNDKTGKLSSRKSKSNLRKATVGSCSLQDLERIKELCPNEVVLKLNKTESLEEKKEYKFLKRPSVSTTDGMGSTPSVISCPFLDHNRNISVCQSVLGRSITRSQTSITVERTPLKSLSNLHRCPQSIAHSDNFQTNSPHQYSKKGSISFENSSFSKYNLRSHSKVTSPQQSIVSGSSPKDNKPSLAEDNKENINLKRCHQSPFEEQPPKRKKSSSQDLVIDADFSNSTSQIGFSINQKDVSIPNEAPTNTNSIPSYIKIRSDVSVASELMNTSASFSLKSYLQKKKQLMEPVKDDSKLPHKETKRNFDHEHLSFTSTLPLDDDDDEDDDLFHRKPLKEKDKFNSVDYDPIDDPDYTQTVSIRIKVPGLAAVIKRESNQASKMHF